MGKALSKCLNNLPGRFWQRRTKKPESISNSVNNIHPSLSAEKPSYSPAVDGLRALAVIAVLLYHAGLGWIKGGFLGVEVFFVISGYLITSLLLSEWLQQGRIDLWSFWLRRARRLLPAVFSLMIGTLAYAVVFLPSEVAALRGDAVATLGYVTNWYLILEQKSYFESVGRPSMLKHLWSLAVEEQFYIFWPLLFAAGIRVLSRRWLLLATVAGATVSTLLMAGMFEPDVDPSRIYYGTDTRASGLLIGASLALFWSFGCHRWSVNSLTLDIAGIVALATLIYLLLVLGEFQSFLYYGGFAAVAISTAVLIAAVIHPRSRFMPAFLGCKPLAWIGLRSYSIYLWHWPVYMATRPQLDVPFDGLPLLITRLAVTGILAELSYRYIETPMRRGNAAQAWKILLDTKGFKRGWLVSRWIGAFLGVIVLIIMVGLAKPPEMPPYLAVDAIEISVEDSVPSVFATATTDLHNSVIPSPTVPSRALMITTPTPVPSIISSASPTFSVPLLAPTPTQITTTATSVALPIATSPSSASISPTPLPTTSPVPVLRVTAIGDSVMLGAVDELKRSIGNVDVDAAVSRQVSAVVDILRSRRDDRKLGNIIILHVGNNGTFSARQFDEIMQILADVGRVVFVNVKVPRQWEGPNNTVLVDGVKRYPNTVLVDWRSSSIGRPDYFWDDGIHLRPTGAKAYVEQITMQIQSSIRHVN